MGDFHDTNNRLPEISYFQPRWTLPHAFEKCRPPSSLEPPPIKAMLERLSNLGADGNNTQRLVCCDRQNYRIFMHSNN